MKLFNFINIIYLKMISALQRYNIFCTFADMAESLTLHNFLIRVKQGIEGSFPSSYWVVGEVNQINSNASGHCYLELIEKQEGSSSPKAKCSAAIWRNNYQIIKEEFNRATGRSISQGMKLLMRLSVSFHPVYGFSLVISQIDPTYTLGEMERQRKATIERLQKEGLFDRNRALVLSLVVQRIAIISSATAAGYGDFMRQLSACAYRFETTLFDSVVQGEGAVDSILSAISRITQRRADFDVVVVIRGGGSQSDLACFDNYDICRALASMQLPIFTGIGHDRDETIADMIAHTRHKTPTAVAAWLVDRMEQLDSYLDSAEQWLKDFAIKELERQKSLLERMSGQVNTTSLNLTRNMELRLEGYKNIVWQMAGRLLQGQYNSLDSVSMMIRERVKNILAAQNLRLERAESLVSGRDPKKILSLGFSIVRFNGSAVKSGDLLNSGDSVEITFAHGDRVAEIK